MILLSVGTQLPFDRLVRVVDDWAEDQVDIRIVGQIGKTNFKPKNMSFFKMGSPAEMSRLSHEAKVVVAHAGTGSILTSLECRKPIIIMPRDHARGEHRNAHQFATAMRFKTVSGVYVAFDEVELSAKLSEIHSLGDIKGVSDVAPIEFSSKLRALFEDR